MTREQVELKEMQKTLDMILKRNSVEMSMALWHYIYGAYCYVSDAIGFIDYMMESKDDTSQIACNSEENNIK